MRAWGSSFDGQLGNGTNTDALTPVTVAGLTDTLSIAACNSVSFALAGLTGTSVVATHAKGQPGQSLSIEAQLLASGTPLAGRSLDVTIDGSPAGTYVTDANGRVSLSYTILESDAYDVFSRLPATCCCLVAPAPGRSSERLARPQRGRLTEPAS